MQARSGAPRYGLPIWPLVPLNAAAVAALLLCMTVLADGDEGWIRGMNAVMPALVGSLCLWASYLMLRAQPRALWTPLPWFLTAWAVYYGFGPLVYIYGTPESVAYMDKLYPVDERTLLRTNVLNMVGLLGVLSSAALFSHVRFGRVQDRRMVSPHNPWRVALIFLAIGVPVKYMFELPYVLGLFDFTLPGSVQYLGTLSGLAILPLTVASHQRRRGARILLWVVILSEIAVGFVMLAKLQVIKTILLVFLGQYAVRPDIKRLVLMGVIVVVAYVTVLSPFVNYARFMLGRASAQNVAETVSAVQEYNEVGREVLAEVLPGVQSWWTRLAYANAQAFAMHEYDQGRVGWTFSMIVYVFVPRFFFEDKPIMTPGFEYTRLIQGTDTSSTGLGIFGEAYWNGGWVFVVATALFVGGLFAVLGRVGQNAVHSGQWLYTPLIFTTVYLGLRPDDWFVPAYVSGVLQVTIVTAALLIMGSSIVKKYPLRSRRSVSINSPPPVLPVISTTRGGIR